MKRIKIPVAVVVFIALLFVALIIYLFHQINKISEFVAVNDRMKLENERFALLTQVKVNKQIEDFKMRESIGFQIR